MGDSASIKEDFNTWLAEKFRALNPDADTDTFVAYLMGVLDVDDDEQNDEECEETIQGIVEELTEHEPGQHTEEIMARWREARPSRDKVPESIAFEDRLTSLMEKQAQEATVKPRQVSKEQQELKRMILSQYGDGARGWS